VRRQRRVVDTATPHRRLPLARLLFAPRLQREVLVSTTL
jgi:hypothetical protein